MTPDKASPSSAELISQLGSDNPQIVIKALHQLEKRATHRDLPAIIRAMIATSDPELINRFSVFLSNVRSTQAPVILAEFLADPASSAVRAGLTRACWESQLDYSPHLLVFAHLFIGGDYTLAVEAFSVLENTCLERPVNPEMVTEITTLLQNSLPDQAESKQRLTRELIHILEPFGSSL